MHEKKKNKQDRITLLGMGNMYMKDDGLGVKALHILEKSYTFPSHVVLIDVGTTIYHNMNILTESDKVIVLDAVKLGDKPGTVHSLSLQEYHIKMPRKVTSHDIGLFEAFSTLKLMDKKTPECIIIGIEPNDYSSWGDYLSPEIENKMSQLIECTFKQLAQWDVHPCQRHS